MDIEIIFSDNHQLVVNKPSGILTQPSGTSQNSLEQNAKNWIKANGNKSGKIFLHAVHRLDKPVSGIVLFARTSKALSRFNESMRRKESKKQYMAIVEGTLERTVDTLEHYLVHDEHQAQVCTQKHPQAKLARLHYEVLKQEHQISWVKIELETGRYHQIRVQFSAIGHPIVGDTRYGSIQPFFPNAIALHHHLLTVPHPITSSLQTFIAPCPF